MVEHKPGLHEDVSKTSIISVDLGDEQGRCGSLFEQNDVLRTSERPIAMEVEDIQPEQVKDEEVRPDLDNEDWLSKLREDELFNGPDGPAPRLHGLRRLAKPFIRREESRVNHLVIVPKQVIRTLQTFNGAGDLMSSNEEIGSYHFPMASVTFFIEDIHGRTFSDSADAFYSNCEELALFPTAVASARAEARTLRKLLGISKHAAEEISNKDPSEELAPDDDSPIKPEQAKLIDKILASLDDYSLKDLLENITTREIYTVEELTTGEARKALRLLNDQKKKNKKKGNRK